MTIEIGVIVEGTTLTADLLEAFIDVLDGETEPTGAMSTDWQEQFELDMAEAQRLLDEDPDGEDASMMVDALITWAEEFAPDYCYIGTAEGDGACWGCWPSFDSIADDLADGELVNADGGDPARAAVKINDHGNTTLFGPAGPDGERPVIWAIV